MPKSNDHRPATICRCGWIHRRGSIPKCPLATPTESMEVPVPPAKKPRTSTTYKVRVQDSRYRLSTLFTQARRRKLECSVSLAQFTQITSQPCRYCGDASSASRGIVRLDNSRGYVPGNMVPSCSRCNTMKKCALRKRVRCAHCQHLHYMYLVYSRSTPQEPDPETYAVSLVLL